MAPIFSKTMANLAAYFLWLLLAVNLVRSQQLPDIQASTISELESILFDGNPFGFFTGVTPCTTYIDSTTTLVNNSLGRQTSAQWIRAAFRKIDPTPGRAVHSDEVLCSCDVLLLTLYSHNDRRFRYSKCR